jgi:hypothetical protein
MATKLGAVVQRIAPERQATETFHMTLYCGIVSQQRCGSSTILRVLVEITNFAIALRVSLFRRGTKPTVRR